jgi:hypothetical protein
VPTLRREAGFHFAFSSRDRPEPPHVHVLGNDGSAKIWLTPSVRMHKARGYSRREREQIVRIAEAHAEEWLASWSRYFGAA